MKYDDWRLLNFKELPSTNDMALEYAHNNKENLVIKAEKQTHGRGRRGRSWTGCEGNLFFSLLLEFDIKKLGSLVIIASYSLLQSIKQLKPETDVCLKWPNDVLINGAKVSGILMEKAEGNYIVIGIGINVAQSPKDGKILYPTVSLKEAGINISCDDFLKLYLKNFTDNVNLYNAGKSSQFCELWKANAKGLGEKIIVKQNNKILKGIFKGIDENAGLLLESNGEVHKILAGDVFYERECDDGI